MSNLNNKAPELLDLDRHQDGRGQLIFGEIGKNWDFDVKRIYFSTGFEKDIIRGAHAHKNLDQVLIAISGSFTVKTEDNNGDIKSWELREAGQALRIYSPTWREVISHSDDAIFLVLASDIYDENDYIRDYNEFKEYVGATS